MGIGKPVYWGGQHVFIGGITQRKKASEEAILER